ncbi:hypothetical protein [Paenibacillus sp. GCM10027629]|uniref:hypothetical protein n=1 Tax=Paenibacillus sp. GCM10027629 TaxID=3273414 RepID=UPI0036D31688
MTIASYNNVSTRGGASPLGLPRVFEEANSADNPARLSGRATRQQATLSLSGSGTQQRYLKQYESLLKPLIIPIGD